MLTKPFAPDEYYSVSEIVKWLGLRDYTHPQRVGGYLYQHLWQEEGDVALYEGGSKGRWTYKGSALNEFFEAHEVRECEAVEGEQPCEREHIGEIGAPPECSWHKGTLQKQRASRAKEDAKNRMMQVDNLMGGFGTCSFCGETHPHSPRDRELHNLYGQCEATMMERREKT